MNIDELAKKIEEQDIVLAKIAHDLRRIKQFFMWSLIGTLVTFVVPLLIAIIAIPIFMGRYLDSFDGLL